ncbi:T-complex 10 C-terminal domain-containing protein [Hymenobacter volaticus]|uniref:T-complex 10 C-terminal domain-containing protein n=1 Tax=Hymenobacter volaticus TaxID=2932254 RepID=A0ABY4G5E4_9BACT|nr:T-complex 10 C-terminal domain-containing protein [Hymenobacter volaticus]UOQ65971.1 T-complex 10 C-terminal domain-containing protein [Hymenobacter volaticus]
MQKTLLLFSAAATLAATACTQDKPAAVDVATTPSADTAVVASRDGANTDTAAYRTDADALAARVAEDLKLTDTVVVTRIEKTYYTRGRRLNEATTRYTTDTTGRYAALRAINDETDQQVRTIIPDQYDTYTANRATYYDGTPYTAATPAPATASTAEAPARRRGPAIEKYEKKANGETKIKYANGKTVKIDKDGDTKVEYPNGTKVKRDADDGELKVKN